MNKIEISLRFSCILLLPKSLNRLLFQWENRIQLFYLIYIQVTHSINGMTSVDWIWLSTWVFRISSLIIITKEITIIYHFRLAFSQEMQNIIPFNAMGKPQQF